MKEYKRLQRITTITSFLTIVLVGFLVVQSVGAYFIQTFLEPMTMDSSMIVKWLENESIDPSNHDLSDDKLAIPDKHLTVGEEFSYIMGLCKHLDVPGYLTVQLVGEGLFDTVVFNDSTKGDVGECRGFKHLLGELPTLSPGKKHLVFHMTYTYYWLTKPIVWEYSFISEDFWIVES